MQWELRPRSFVRHSGYGNRTLMTILTRLGLQPL